MTKIAPYWKAVIGFIAPGAVIIGASTLPGSDGGSVVTGSEIITAAVACVVTSAGVYAKGNKDDRGSHQSESVQPPSA